MSEANNLIVNNSKPLIGNIQIPGDKSISHRSIILGALCKGDLLNQNFYKSDDSLAQSMLRGNLVQTFHSSAMKFLLRGKVCLVLKNQLL